MEEFSLGQAEGFYIDAETQQHLQTLDNIQVSRNHVIRIRATLTEANKYKLCCKTYRYVGVLPVTR